jgi:hypothetical protein
MSSFKAKFEFEGTEFDVLSCNYSFGQATDEAGRPASDVKSGSIFLQITASDDEKIIGWMIDPYKKANGKVTFFRTDQDSKLKEISFEDAHCVGYSESFSSTSATAMTISLNISTRKLTVGNASHESYQ